MSLWSNRLSRKIQAHHDATCRGAAAVEMAILSPLLILLTVGVVEYGRTIEQANAVEKGLEVAGQFAARATYPMTATEVTRLNNLAKHGNKEGTGAYLVSGWDKAGASLVITTRTVDIGGAPVVIYKLDATVPFDPVLPGLATSFGFMDFNIRASQEVAYVGN
ncbi:MAG: pilus assembly protein [Alphaproteobacteria bacterium]|nr:pilus assembly protein [Alphaproteobacteria bacterium]